MTFKKEHESKLLKLVQVVVILLLSSSALLAATHSGERYWLNPDISRDKRLENSSKPSVSTEERQAIDFLNRLEVKSNSECHKVQVASWNYESNMSEANQEILHSVDAENSEYEKQLITSLRSTFDSSGPFPNWDMYQPMTRRRIRLMTESLGAAILPTDEATRYRTILSTLERIHATASICLPGPNATCGLQMDPSISELTAMSRDYDLLAHVWKAWRNATGAVMRPLYLEFMQLENKIATMNGYANAADMWTAKYESPTFQTEMDAIWRDLAPLYSKVHAYVRAKLATVYGDRINKKDPIPAHILGNPWAQEWGFLVDIAIPHQELVPMDVTDSLKRKGYTPEKMAKTAEEFFTSLGLKKMTPTFWEKSILVRPPGRDFVCHPSAWDFCLGKDNTDFRIKMCADVNHQDFITMHHEMGHVQYFKHYKHLPIAFRDGANPGFHEAIGDTVSLSVSTPKHLKKIGLLTREQNDLLETKREEMDLNFLMSMALDKIVFLPFAYIVDKWRWDLFKGIVPLERLNAHWWKLREEIQGVSAPIARSELDFDPGSKYHIAANIPYIRYFVSFVVQFQFYESLCKVAEEYDPGNQNIPLHRCDFYGNHEAGRMLREVMRQGRSKPWEDVMRIMTGQKKISASSLRTYFAPLEKYLDEYLKKTNECVGWAGECD